MSNCFSDLCFHRKALFEEDAYTYTRSNFCLVVVMFNHLKCYLVIPTVIFIVKRKGVFLETGCGNTTRRCSALMWMNCILLNFVFHVQFQARGLVFSYHWL